jgi:PAS domain-containing protein
MGRCCRRPWRQRPGIGTCSAAPQDQSSNWARAIAKIVDEVLTGPSRARTKGLSGYIRDTYRRRERPMTLMLLPDLPKGVRPVVTPIVDTADAAFVMSLDYQFLAWGSRAQQLFGFSPPDVLGRYCYDVLPARDASGQCLCSVNCPMVVAARYGYSVPRRRLASVRNRTVRSGCG